MPATCGRREFSGGLAFWGATLPKRDRSPAENEDAAAWCLAARRFALSDGATDAALSAPWAANLVRQFVCDPTDLTVEPMAYRLAEWLSPIQRSWCANVPWDRLAWYAEEKARRGAFATLIGLTINAPPPVSAASAEGAAEVHGILAKTTWRAVAVGDTCLFHWRGEQLLAAFPLTDSAAFGNSPYLIGSQPEWNRELTSHWRRTEGTCRPGDQFLLATDALARWLLGEFEASRWRFADLIAIDDDAAFEAFIAELRRTRELRNDDTTLLHLRIGHDFFGTPGAPGALPRAVPEDSVTTPREP